MQVEQEERKQAAHQKEDAIVNKAKEAMGQSGNESVMGSQNASVTRGNYRARMEEVLCGTDDTKCDFAQTGRVCSRDVQWTDCIAVEGCGGLTLPIHLEDPGL